MKKFALSVLIITIMCLMYAAAGAAPSVTDGKTTGWIAENNYLFLQTTGGTVAQLSMEINDLIRITEDELICLGGNDQIIAVKTNGSGSRIVPDAETAALKEPQLKTEEGKLLMDGRTVSEKAVVAATDGVYVYYVEKIGLSSFVLRVTPVVNDGRLVQSRTRDAYAESFSDKAVTEPASLTVTREALTLTDMTHNVTVMNLLTGEMATYPATTGWTAAACMQGGMLYRYLLTEEGHWVLESVAAVSTPTPAPTATPTPKPTAKPTSYYDDDGTIYYGAYGSKVRKIQTRLNELGYPIWGIDGKYGEETQLAINLFCDAIHVREHRYITSRVQKKLFAKDAPYYDPYLPLKKGDQGVSVYYMQARLKELGYDPGQLDGIYGKNTIAAVASFQADNGMLPGPGEKELPGEMASHELLELLYSPEPSPVPTADPTPTGTPTPMPTATSTPTPTATVTPTPTAAPTSAPTPTPASQTDL